MKIPALTRENFAKKFSAVGASMKKNKGKHTSISMEDVRKSIRIPLPVQTGGIHKDTKRVSRRDSKVHIRKGEWD